MRKLGRTLDEAFGMDRRLSGPGGPAAAGGAVYARAMNVIPRVLRFGGFELDNELGELRRRGTRVTIQAQPLKILALLAARAGDVVSREEIRVHVWGEETFVDHEQGINGCIRQIRQVLRDNVGAPRFLETVPRHGYRFVAPVECEVDAGAASDRDVGFSRRRFPRPRTWLGLGGAALAALLAVVVVTALSAGGRRPADKETVVVEPSSRPLLAILPFRDLSPGGSEQHLADGMTEELIGRVSQRYGGRLGVIAPTSAMRYRASSQDVGAIASELGASYVLEGSVRRVENRLRVSARLIRASDRVYLWTGRYDREVTDVLAIEREVSAKIGQALALGLRIVASAEDDAGAATRGDAYEAFLKGRYGIEKILAGDLRPEVLRDARAHFAHAADLDPGFAPAYVSLARTYLLEFPDSSRGRSRARRELEKALALDESLPRAHLAMALHHFYFDWDLEAAGRSFERAIEADPGYAKAHHQHAAYFSVKGRHDEAVAAVERALRLDPLSPDVGSDVGWYFYFGRRYSEAIEHSRRTLEITPGFFWARRAILLAAMADGEPVTAVEEARRDLRALGAGDEVVAGLDGVAPVAALRRYWLWRRDEALARSAPAIERADVHMALGENDRALAALEEAYRERQGWILPFLGVHPLYDPLRSDPRFVKLVERIGVGRVQNAEAWSGRPR